MELFRLLGIIALSGDEEAKAKMNGVTDNAQKGAGKIGKALGTMGKVAAGVMAAGATAAATLTKTAVDSFAEYEQLVGGSKLLYGDAYDFVRERAKKAYQDVQMSQSEYLEQMNGFATGLKTALGGDAHHILCHFGHLVIMSFVYKRQQITHPLLIDDFTLGCQHQQTFQCANCLVGHFFVTGDLQLRSPVDDGHAQCVFDPTDVFIK